MFVDTSALYALMDADDSHHAAAATAWEALLDAEESLHTTNYVLVETFALAQRRLGVAAARILQTGLLPVVSVSWVTRSQDEAAVNAVLSANRRDLSLVDCASFQMMRDHGETRAFAFDEHFSEQGFEVVPG